MEKEMRNSLAYKLLNWVDWDDAMKNKITPQEIFDFVKDEAPETYELWVKDNQEIPDCSPAGEPNAGDFDESEFTPGDGVVYSIVRNRQEKEFHCTDPNQQCVYPNCNCRAKLYDCPHCDRVTDNPVGVCYTCDGNGVWLDKEGKVHFEDEQKS